MKTNKSTHGGKREGAGRKPAQQDSFLKKFRATEEEREEFKTYLAGNARRDFLLVLSLLREYWKGNIDVQ